MTTPTRHQILAALELLAAAGYRIEGPPIERLRLLDPHQVAELVGCAVPKAREIITHLPNSVRLPGGDLRARVQDLEQWLEEHAIARARP